MMNLLADIAEVSAGQSAPQGDEYFSQEGIPFVRAGSLDLLLNGGSLEDLEKINPEVAKKAGMRLFPKGSVLFAKSGMSAMKNRVYVLPEAAFVVSHLAVIIPKENLYNNYFRYWLKFFKPSSLIRDRAYPSIRLEDIGQINFPKILYSEQKKIASILEQADSAREKRRQANVLTEQFLQSAFLEMFGDPIRNEKGWEMKKMNDVASKIQIGPFGTQLHEEDYIDDGIPLINPTNISDGKIELNINKSISEEKFLSLPNYHLQSGDIIMGRRGEMGRCALVTEKENGWMCGTGSLFLRPNSRINSTYLLFVMTGDSMKTRLENDAQGVTMANLNLSIIKNLDISLPPLTKQKKFAQLVEQVEKLRSKQRKSETELENLFQSLMQRYFG
jgi:type I restriction enzyme S subunit